MHPGTRDKPAILFCSYHCYADTSSGAMISTREMLELLAARGWDCRAFTGPALDFQQPRRLGELLAKNGVRFASGLQQVEAETVNVYRYFDDERQSVPVTLVEPAEPCDAAAAGAAFLALVDRLLADAPIDVMLTFGGDELHRRLFALARARGVAVVFSLRNMQYSSRALFEGVDSVLVASRYTRDQYKKRLGIDASVVPNVIRPEHCVADSARRRFVTFVNPLPHKGMHIFSALAGELARRRPDIAFLVVESRGLARDLYRTGLDAGGLSNVWVMGNTPDPRDFYALSKIVLVPSLVNETFGRVAAEAMAAGIPVIVSNRGALPEVAGDGGLVLDIPARYTADIGLTPSSAEIAPWIAAIERLWDDPVWYQSQQRRGVEAAKRYHPGMVAAGMETYLQSVIKGARKRRKAGRSTGFQPVAGRTQAGSPCYQAPLEARAASVC